MIGRDFWRGAVADLSVRKTGASVSARLMTLVRKDLIKPARSIFPWEDGFRFRHALIRDAAYLAIPKETRAGLHEQFAGWLERTRASGRTSSRRSRLPPRAGVPLSRGARACGAGGRDSRFEPASGWRGRPSRDRRPRRPAAAASACSAGRPRSCRRITLCEGAPIELASLLMTIGAFERADEVVSDALSAAQAAGDDRLEMRGLIERESFKVFTAQEVSAWFLK